MKLPAALLLACASFCQADTGCAYNPQNNGSWITYSVFTIGGYWHPDNKQFSVASGTRHETRNSPQTITHVDIFPGGFAPLAVTASQYQSGAISNPPPNAGAVNDIVGIYEGFKYFGDVGDPLHGIVVTPGEPELPFAPVGGEHIGIDHQVAVSTSGQTIFYSFHTEYWTIGHYATWGSFSDCWWTCVIEYRPAGSGGPGTPYQYYDASVGLYISCVFQFVWARGIGQVDLWYGTPDANGAFAAGHEYYAIAWGQN